MHPPRDPAVDLLPRTVRRSTTLARGVAIIHPADPASAALAARLAAALTAAGAEPPECVSDLALMLERSSLLPPAYRTRPLILLGNLNTNRALQPLYADYLCSTDATYPGGDGYDLRTIVNPHGTGANVILAGGSSASGVERAVERLLAAFARAAGATLTLPFLLEVELAPSLAASLAAWPYTPLDDTPEQQALRNRGLMFYTEGIRVIGAYTLMWSWTADERYALIARENLRALNAKMTGGYGDWHYLAERFLRAVPLLIAGGFLDDADIARTDHLLLLTAQGNETEWWRMTTGQPPLGHRHHGKGTYEFLLLARYLRDQANPTPALRALCDRWIGECCTFLDTLSAACIDDQDDESTLNNLATLYRYALGFERHGFFTSGRARQVARRCLALHDNNGNGAGQGGYGESQGMYLQQEATEQTACSAFYYGDGRLKWILQTMPNLEISQRYPFLRYAPVFLQKYDTGPELVPVPPPAGEGVTVLPVTDHQFAISNRPPEHVEPAGHLVNAPETWQLAEAIGLNRLPQARGFDKIVLRGGFARRDAYLMIQGYQGGFRWQGHMQAANAIVRFFQAGHVWLVQNTSRHSYHDKNGILISDGANDTPMPPFAERCAVADFAPLALTVTRVTDYHHTDWTRHLFWSKAGAGCFVVIDRVAFKADGPYSLTCSWRTPGHAELQGRRWHSEQGQHCFTLVSGAEVDATCEVDTDQGACSPYVLRQRRAGEHRAGDEGSFQNLFYVRPLDHDEALDLQRLDERSVLVRRNGVAIAWAAAALSDATSWLPGARAQALSAWAEATSLTLAGATSCQLAGAEWKIRSDRPIGLRFAFDDGTLTLCPDSPGGEATRVSVAFGVAACEIELKKTVTLPLPAFAVEVAHALGSWLGTLQAVLVSIRPGPTAPPEIGWASTWSYDSGSRVPEVVRNVRITADPLPVNGSPDEMLDPVMPDGYSRETWIQWPRAARYAITLTLPEPRVVTALNILGDCIDDPTLRTFNPLPNGIVVEAEAADGTRRTCAVTPAPDRRYKRYRDAENRLQVRTAAVGGTVRALHVSLDAPADGQPFVLHRLEVLGDGAVTPVIEKWLAADLDGDGHEEVVVVNALSELIVLDVAGRERWRHTLPVPVTHISAQPLDPQGSPVLCVGLLGGDVHLYRTDGALRQEWRIAEKFRLRKDCLQGWYNAAHSLGIWRRDAAGHGCLVLGGYGIIVFLDAEGGIVGHSFSDGPWNYDILVAPEPRADSGDLYVRCGWNHGIQYYERVPGGGPSGEVYHLGGFNQPMFHMLRRVIPFLNGRSLAAEWVDLPACPEGAMFFVTELGCGVLSTARKDWLWKLEGGMSLNAVSLGVLGAECTSVAFIGGAEGFVAAVNLVDGSVARRRHVGAPVVGVCPAAGGGLLVTTRTGVLQLDADWQVLSAVPRPLLRSLPLSDGRLLLLRDDQTLELIEHTL